VVGDVAVLRAGQRVPADVRILRASGLKLESSDISGDHHPIDYTHEATAAYVSVLDARNVAFKGSYCTEGDAIAVVIRTGKYTMLGSIAGLQSRVELTQSILQQQISRFVNLISVVAIAMGAFFFVVGCLVSELENVLYHFITGFLIVIVANVPQGLPPTVMSQLAIFARRMAKKIV
jgi:sodium/potassium-transporting ATPase subunit alpha